MNTISFPKMFDINNSKLATNLSYNYKSIHESLTSLLMTNPGELLGDPKYGCGIRMKLFDIKNNMNINELKITLVDAINEYVPQINTDYSLVKIYSDSNNNKYKITIGYTIKDSKDLETFEIIL